MPSELGELLRELQEEEVEEAALRARREAAKAGVGGARPPTPGAKDSPEEEEGELELPDFEGLLVGQLSAGPEGVAPQQPAAEAEGAAGVFDEELTAEAKQAIAEVLGPLEKPQGVRLKGDEPKIDTPETRAESVQGPPSLPLTPPRAPPAPRPIPKSRFAGGRVNGGRVNGGRVNGGRVNGGRVNGGRVNGGRVNGGRVNGGRVNGGRVNGGTTSALQGMPRRAASRRKVLTASLALLVLTSILVPLYSTLNPGPVVHIDGNFGDWAGYSIVRDSATDEGSNPNINMVGFSARADSRDLYFYLQFEQGALLFEGGANASGADAYRILIDADRSTGTGFLALGLGVDFLVVLTGFNGALQSRELHAFPGAAPDRADASGFFHTGGVAAAWTGNQLEGSVALRAIGLGDSARPFVLALTQDAAGNSDVGDAVITTLPGVLKLTQDGIMAPVLPTIGESRLFTLTARAEGADVRLLALTLRVESPDGGGLQLTRVVVGSATEAVAAGGGGGALLRVPVGEASSQMFLRDAPGKTIELYGRGTGPVGSVVRMYIAGPQDVEASAAQDGTSGLGSFVPPSRYSLGYIGEAPPFVKIDGAFADWNQSVPANPDPLGDVRTGLSGPTMGAPNVGTGPEAGLDIVASRAEVSSSTRQVSFMLEVAGSVMAPALLPRPTRPSPAQPSGGSSGTPSEPVPQPSRPPSNLAAIYVDTDINVSTGWTAFAGLGVDAIVEIGGTGGGYGRSPRQTETSIAQWNPAAQNFARAAASLAVGFNSSALETQVSFAALCGGSCADIRYVFYLQDAASHGDSTTVRDGTTRTLGNTLYFDEQRTSTRNVFQGGNNLPILAFAVAAPSTNGEIARVNGFQAVVDGATPTDLVSFSVFNDSAPRSSLDPADLSAGPLASAPLNDGGTVEVRLPVPISLAPGEQFSGLFTVDVGVGAETPSWFSVTIAGHGGLRATGIEKVVYGFSPEPSPVRILAAPSGSRGQNNLTVNEVNVSADWVEIYDTTGASTDLTSSSQMSLFVYEIRSGQPDVWLAFLNLTGSTNSSGFAVFNISIKAGTGPRNTVVEIRCNNCSAGGGDNSTYVDQVVLPQGAFVQWGRYPDGTGNWTSTTNTTRGTANEIPEFGAFARPIMGVLGLVAAVRWAGPKSGSFRRGRKWAW